MYSRSVLAGVTEGDDDIEEYLDPELDAAVAGSDADSGGFPSLLSVGGLIMGLHFLAALLVLPVAWVAVQNGSYGQAAFYSMLGGLMAAAGVLVGRIAERRLE
jgi:hypothetical protein